MLKNTFILCNLQNLIFFKHIAEHYYFIIIKTA